MPWRRSLISCVWFRKRRPRRSSFYQPQQGFHRLHKAGSVRICLCISCRSHIAADQVLLRILCDTDLIPAIWHHRDQRIICCQLLRDHWPPNIQESILANKRIQLLQNAVSGRNSTEAVPSVTRSLCSRPSCVSMIFFRSVSYHHVNRTANPPACFLYDSQRRIPAGVLRRFCIAADVQPLSRAKSSSPDTILFITRPSFLVIYQYRR